MEWIFLTLGILAVLILLLAYYCYREAFAVLPRHNTAPQVLPEGPQYDALQQEMLEMINGADALPFTEVSVTTRDGLTLYGRLYERDPSAPTQLMMHGYRSNPIRDFSGGVLLAWESGRNVLLVDQRAHGKSQGRCLSFGILEKYDCLAWIHYLVGRYGPDARIIPTGLSMGASTVLMATELELPANVIGIIADCGYSSPEQMIRRVIKALHYPPEITYRLIRLGGLLYGGFDIQKHSVPQSLKNCKVPVWFIHGEDDRLVPFEMALENYDACPTHKQLLRVPGAGHGLSYLVDTAAYHQAIAKFLQVIGGE